MRVYDTEGKAHDKEPIDVAECVNNLGWTREPPTLNIETIRSEILGSGESTDTSESNADTQKPLNDDVVRDEPSDASSTSSKKKAKDDA